MELNDSQFEYLFKVLTEDNTEKGVASINNEMQYLRALSDVMMHGTDKGSEKTGLTRSTTGVHMRFDLRDGFPLLTTKRVFWKGILAELLWFISGDNHVGTLKDQGVHIWDEWEKADGTIGRGYGVQWRRAHEFTFASVIGPVDVYCSSEVDQLSRAIDLLKTEPECRRIIVDCWQLSDLPHMALPPCHTMFQFVAQPADGEGLYYLDLVLHQRSGDMFLGVPFNIASYAALLTLVANEVKMIPRFFIHNIADAHIYHNHFAAVGEQLQRRPCAPPQLALKNPSKSIFEVTIDDIELQGYEPQSRINAEVFVHPDAGKGAEKQ